MSSSKKNNRYENETENQNSQSASTTSKDLVDHVPGNPSGSDVIPDDVERRDGPGGN